MQVLIADIRVKKRIRKEMGDITALADSLKKFGQINPIVITKNNVLVAGERRLTAAKSIGWKTINAVIVELDGPLAKLEYEVEENLQRQEFSAQEEADAKKKLYRLRNPGFFRRILNAIIYFFKRLFKIDN